MTYKIRIIERNRQAHVYLHWVENTEFFKKIGEYEYDDWGMYDFIKGIETTLIALGHDVEREYMGGYSDTDE